MVLCQDVSGGWYKAGQEAIMPSLRGPLDDLRFKLTKSNALHDKCRVALQTIAKMDQHLAGHKTEVSGDHATVMVAGLTLRISFCTVSLDRANLVFGQLLADADGRHSYHHLTGVYVDAHGMLYHEVDKKTADFMETVEDGGEWYVSILASFYDRALSKLADWLSRDDSD
jgi:hypothetical protein